VAGELAAAAGVAYEQVLVNDQDLPRLRAVLDRAATAARSGTPVPLYVGDALPRHVVLLTGHTDGAFDVFDPSRGTLLRVPQAELTDGRHEPLAALGGWRHLSWAVLPRR
jgi:hypothetical protein